MKSLLVGLISNIVVICIAGNASVSQASESETHAITKTTMVEEPWIPAEDDFISLATGRQQLIKDAPANVAVIT